MHTIDRHTPSPGQVALVLADSPADGDRSSRTALLICAGEFDPLTAPVLRGALTRAVCHRPNHLVVDLGRVTFMDASTVGEIVRARRTLRAQRATLALRDVSNTWKRLIGRLGLEDLIEQDIDAAAA